MIFFLNLLIFIYLFIFWFIFLFIKITWLTQFVPVITSRNEFCQREKMFLRRIFIIFYSFRDVETSQLSIRFLFLYTSLYIHLFDWFFISSLFCLLTYVHSIWYSFISIFQLIKSFDFEFGFCIPGSVNTWDAVYSLPAMSEKLSTNFLKIWIMIVNSIFYYVLMF